MITEKHITVPRSLRYYTSGFITDFTENIWILLHGHGQLAGEFLKIFSDLSHGNSYLIAPEGLMRFYLKGSYGDVGASWMTKEDRLQDISDYVNYLDMVYDKEVGKSTEKCEVNALGFSQGAATLSRWLAFGRAKVNKAVFWCGEIASDIDFSKPGNLKHSEIYQVFGDEDKLFSRDFPQQQKMILETAGLKTKLYMFSGGHEINSALMKKVGIINC